MRTTLFNRSARFGPVALAALTLLTFIISVTPTQAETVLWFAAPTFTAAAGSSGSFDLAVFSTGGNVNLAAESVNLAVGRVLGDIGITFTDVTIATSAPYVFITSTGPPLSFDTFPNTSFTSSDLELADPGYSVVSSTPLGLAHVSYTIDPNATAGLRTLTFLDIGGGTSATDNLGGSIQPGIVNGSILVTVASSVSLPSTLLMGLTLLTALFLVRQRRARYDKVHVRLPIALHGP